MIRTNTKERLLEAALTLFSEKGYDGTSVDEIAESIGIKGPIIYKYFKGKEALLAEIVAISDEAYEKGMENGLRGADRIKSGADLKAVALQSITMTMDNEIARKVRKLFTIEQFRSPIFADRATRNQVINLQSVFAKVFRKMMADGIMKEGNAEIYALEFTAPVTLMLQMCDREPHKKDEALKTIECHMDTFINRYFIA